MKKEVICGIYKITSPTGKVYIGQSKNIKNRWAFYNSPKGVAEQPALHKSLKKHGPENHQFDIIEYCSEDELNCSERFWQDEFDVLNGGLNCVLTECGEKKAVTSENTRKKQSLSRSGGKGAMWGRCGELSPSFGKIPWNKGLIFLVRGKNPASKKVIDTSTGQIFECKKDAADFLGINHTTFYGYLGGVHKNPTMMMLLEDYEKYGARIPDILYTTKHKKAPNKNPGRPKKILLTLLLLFSFLGFSQSITYTASASTLSNPERGFWKFSDTHASNYTLVNQATLTTYRTSNNITVLYRGFYLDSFFNSPISAGFLANMQIDFNRIRNAGLKVQVRIAYTDTNLAVSQPSKAQILSHIAQIAPVLQANSDVIATIQCGWIGKYGEWYTTGSTEFGDGDYNNYTTTQWNNRKEIVEATLAACPNIIVQLRYPFAKQKFYGNTPLTPTEAFTNTSKARTGIFNDAFLNIWGDEGTFQSVGSQNGTPSTAEKTYTQNETKYTLITGESNGVNAPRTDCTNAITEMDYYNWCTLNRDYYPANLTNWISNTCFAEIENRLGYRFQLISSTYTTGNLNLKLQNVGFGHLFNSRPAYITAISSAGTRTNILINSDARLWLKGSTIDLNIDLSSLPADTYNLYLWMPDASVGLQSNSAYSVQMANVGVWNNATGLNSLNQIIVVSPAAGCATTTTWNGSSWSAGTPNVTTTAIINAPYTVTGTGLTVNFDCCNLIVNSTLQINNNRFVTVQNDITVTGTLLVKSGGRLVQVLDTGVNTGNITVERTTTPLNYADYEYFSSPVGNTIGQSFSTWNQSKIFSFNTSNFYDVETSYNGTFISNIADGVDDDGNSWLLKPQSANMIPGQGVAAMVELAGTFPRSETVNFTGALNSGIVTVPLQFSANTAEQNDDYNLIGNPFSSSLLADSFIIANLPAISGTLYFWTHGLPISSAYSGLFQLNFTPDNYAYYGLSGGLASPAGGPVPNGFISSTQGFLVEAETTGPVVIKHELLAAGYPNTQFFRSAVNDKKIWLTLAHSDGIKSKTLIAYTPESDLNYNKGWDTKLPLNRNILQFYSLQNGEKYKIQGRGLWNNSDVVDLGFKTEVSGEFTISLDSIVGLQNVYLKEGINYYVLPHTFTTTGGEENFRFQLVFNQDLSLNDFLLEKVAIYPNPINDSFEINLGDYDRYKYSVYDVSGRLVYFRRDKNKFWLNVQKGVYFLTINDGTIKKSIKFVK